MEAIRHLQLSVALHPEEGITDTLKFQKRSECSDREKLNIRLG
jgi:hypothetical protein